MSYRETLRTPGLARLYLASIVARLPLGFGTLAVVLVVRDATGSFSIAGAAAGAELFTSAAVAAPLGRAVDRFGQARVLLPVAAFNATALVGLGLAGQLDAPAGVLIALAACVGVMPPISACHRTLLAAALSGQKLQTAYGLESVLQETMYTGGPLLVAAAVAIGEPQDALFAGAAFIALGTVLFTGNALSRSWAGTREVRPRGGAMRAPVVRLLSLYGVCAGLGFGAYEVAVVAFAREHGHPDVAGLLLALWAIGSMTGGLWYGARKFRRAAGRRFLEVSVIMAAGFLPAVVAPSTAWLAPCMLISGLAVAPMASLAYTLLGELAPAGMVTESFTWINTAFPVGIGAGAAVAGLVVDGPGARAGLALAIIGPAIGAVVAATWRSALLAGGNPQRVTVSPDSADA